MTVEALVYSEGGVHVREPSTPEELRAVRAEPGTSWVRATGLDAGELDDLRTAFDLHPLAVEDVQNAVRPKVEEFDDYAFVLAKTARLVRGETSFEEEIDTVPVGLFVGRDWLVSVTPEPVEAVERVWATVLREESRMLSRGPDFSAYRVLDGIVDDYFLVLDDVEDRIELIEDDVVAEPDEATLQHINGVRRDLLSFRKLLWPSREAAGVLARGDPDQVAEPTEKYFRDVYDHLVQLVDLTETYRDLTAGTRDIYLNALSMSTNEVMKKLTVVATIVLPLTLVVGVFGMNFAGSPYAMPELEWRYGYPAVMIGMALVAAVLIGYFRREDWL